MRVHVYRTRRACNEVLQGSEREGEKNSQNEILNEEWEMHVWNDGVIRKLQKEFKNVQDRVCSSFRFGCLGSWQMFTLGVVLRFSVHIWLLREWGGVTDECIIMILGMTIIIIIVLFSFQIHISNQSTFTRQLIMNSLTLKLLIFSMKLTAIPVFSQNLSTSQFSQTIQNSIKSSLAFDENYVFSPFSLASQLLHIQHLMNAGA